MTTRSQSWFIAGKPLQPIALTAALLPGMAMSQVASSDLPGAGDAIAEIIVTAQKRAQSTQDIGITVSALNQDQLNALNVTDIKGIAQLTPGFTVAQSYRGPPIYTIRGVGFDTPNASSSSPVGIYYDEVSYPYPAMTAGPSFDLERVEILKGPQGTLYGRNTTGGLVNSIAVKPSDEQSGYIKVGAGNYGSYSFEGAINGQITDGLDARLSFDDIRSTRGWQVNIVDGSRLGKVDKAGARLQLEWRPTGDLKFLLSGNWWQDKSDTQAGQVIEVYPKAVNTAVTPANAASIAATLNGLGLPGNRIVNQAFNPSNASQADWVTKPFQFQGTVGGNTYNPVPVGDLQKDNNLDSIALRSEWTISPTVNFTSLTSYSEYKQAQGEDIVGWSIPDAIAIDKAGIKSFSQELRLSGETDRLTWLTGLFYAHDTTSENNLNWGPTGTNIGPLRTLAAATVAAQGGSLAEQQDVQYGFTDWADTIRQSVVTESIFGQGQFKITEPLQLTLGARYTRDTAKFTGCTVDQGDNSIASVWNVFFRAVGISSNVAPGGCVTYDGDLAKAVTSGGAIPIPMQGLARQSLDQNNVAGRIGLDYHFAEHDLVYASFTRGFKSGAFPNIDANVSVQYKPAVEERLDAYEVGIKSRPLSNLTLNGALFYYQYKDKQVFGAIPDIIFTVLNTIVNIPKSHLYGAEADATFIIAKGLTANLSGTYIKTHIDTYAGFDQFGNPQNFSGDQFAFTPKGQLNALLNYNFNISSRLVGNLTGDVRYTSAQQADLISDPAFAIKSYTLADASFGIGSSDSKYDLIFYVKNLTDKYYWTSVQNIQDSIDRYAGMPRTYGATFEMKF